MEMFDDCSLSLYSDCNSPEYCSKRSRSDLSRELFHALLVDVPHHYMARLFALDVMIEGGGR